MQLAIPKFSINHESEWITNWQFDFFILIYFPIRDLCIVRCIDEQKDRVVEGELRCKELAQFLDDHRATKNVWLSEDATAIVQKISYDPKTNQLVGIVLPFNSEGNPKPFRFVFYSS